MADEINRTADWEPGTLDKTRKNIGLIDEKEAATMAKKLGGQVMYERTTSSSGSQGQGGHGQGRIIRSSDGGGGSKCGSGSSGGSRSFGGGGHYSHGGGGHSFGGSHGGGTR